jgi:hypothetical protein
MPDEAQLDRERLMRISNEVIATITSPEFIERMREARSRADDGAGFDEAAELLSMRALREFGADIPKDFRVTSRVFEDREQGLKLELDNRRPGVDSSPVGFGICVGGGGDSFCACGGFTTGD